MAFIYLNYGMLSDTFLCVFYVSKSITVDLNHIFELTHSW